MENFASIYERDALFSGICMCSDFPRNSHSTPSKVGCNGPFFLRDYPNRLLLPETGTPFFHPQSIPTPCHCNNIKIYLAAIYLSQSFPSRLAHCWLWPPPRKLVADKKITPKEAPRPINLCVIRSWRGLRFESRSSEWRAIYTGKKITVTLASSQIPKRSFQSVGDW